MSLSHHLRSPALLSTPRSLSSEPKHDRRDQPPSPFENDIITGTAAMALDTLGAIRSDAEAA